MVTGAQSAVLRPEAQPASYACLDPRQKDAFAGIVELFDAAVIDVDQSDGTAVHRIGPFLDPHRSNRTILVSGQRGTGKTTLLLSLVRALRDEALSGPAADDLPPPVRDRLTRLRRRLVWLETLDMEPLPGAANLLGGVLARVEAAVSDLFTTSPPGPVPGLLSPSNTYHNAVDELRRLQTTVALTFDGNLQSRAGSLDPDTYAVEVRRTERERIGITERFGEVLAGLSTAIGATTQYEAPLFVLAVDDLDLNPAACVPLLELLRAAHSPHLIVMLVADQDLLQTILRLKYRSDLAQLAHPTGLDRADEGRADALADNALRKHLPLHQRVMLSRIEPTQALKFRPLGGAGPVLRDLIGEVVLAADTLGLSTDSSVTAPGPELRLPTTEAEPATHHWPEVLRVTFRELVDFYYTAASDQDTTGARPGAPLRAAAAYRLDEISKLLPGGRARGGFGESVTVRSAEAWSVVDSGPGHRIMTARVVRWDVRLRGEISLGPEDGAALLGALDVVGGEHWLIDLRVPVLRRTERTSRPAGRLSLDWPMVTHTIPWGYTRAQRMLHAADRAWAKQDFRWHGAWVATMTALLEEAQAESPLAHRAAKVARNWEDLAGRLHTLPRGPLVDEWLVSVGWLCTPEMGVYDEQLAHLLVRDDLMQTVMEERERRFSGWA